MTRDVSTRLSAAFEALGWNHTVTVTSGDHVLTLNISQMAGNDLLSLFGVLAPGGTPIPTIDVVLTTTGLTVQ